MQVSVRNNYSSITKLNYLIIYFSINTNAYTTIENKLLLRHMKMKKGILMDMVMKYYNIKGSIKNQSIVNT